MIKPFRCLAIALSCIMAFSSVYADDFEKDMTKALANTINYVNTHQDSIWPGFNLSAHSTILLFDKNEHAYAYHFSPLSQGWKLLNIENSPVYYSIISPYDFPIHGNFVTEFEGQISSIHMIDDDNLNLSIQDNLSYIVSNQFWNFVYSSHIPQTSWDDYYKSKFDSFNEIENIKLAFLASEALKSYLQTSDMNALKDFQAIENQRYAISNADSQKFQKILNILFVLNHYVGLKSLNLNDNEYRNMILNSKYYDRDCNYFQTPQDIRFCMSYSRNEWVDDAIEYALDKINAEWVKKEFIPFMGKIDVHDILDKTLHMSLREQVERIEDAKSHYHYDVISQKVETIMNPYLKEMHTLLENYKNSPNTEINFNNICLFLDVALPGDPAFYPNSRTRLSKDYSANYSCSNCYGGYNSLSLHNIPIFIENYDSQFINQFKLPNNTTLIINNEKDTVGSFVAGHKLKTFNKLAIQNSSVNIEVNEPGIIDGSTGKLFFRVTSIDLKIQKPKNNADTLNEYVRFYQKKEVKRQHP